MLQTFKIHKNWILLFLSYFILLLVANIIFPVTFDDDFAYAQLGNPFYLQWAEYQEWHGRYISHTLLRIILQSGLQNFIIALLGAVFPFIAYIHVNPLYLLKFSTKDFYAHLLLSSLFFGFISISWSAYTFTTYFMSNFFAQMTILLFLIPYRKLISYPTYKPSLYYLIIIGIIAGSMQEQGVIIIPLLLILAIILKFTKQSLPSWFFVGCGAYFIGNLFLFLAPSTLSDQRLIGYGGVENWEFLGNTYHWINIGIVRHWYSFLKILFFDTFAYLPNAFLYLIVWGILLYHNIKKNHLSTMSTSSIIFVIASFGAISAMMFSPLYYSANLNWGLIYLFIALVITFREYLDTKEVFIIPKITACISLIIYIISLFAWTHYRKEYNIVVKQITQAQEQQLPKVIVKPFTQFIIPTPFGNILPVYLYRGNSFYSRMATYYSSPPIIIQD